MATYIRYGLGLRIMFSTTFIQHRCIDRKQVSGHVSIILAKNGRKGGWEQKQERYCPRFTVQLTPARYEDVGEDEDIDEEDMDDDDNDDHEGKSSSIARLFVEMVSCSCHSSVVSSGHAATFQAEIYIYILCSTSMRNKVHVGRCTLHVARWTRLVGFSM